MPRKSGKGTRSAVKKEEVKTDEELWLYRKRKFERALTELVNKTHVLSVCVQVREREIYTLVAILTFCILFIYLWSFF